MWQKAEGRRRKAEGEGAGRKGVLD